jgi:hypothetical protein
MLVGLLYASLDAASAEVIGVTLILAGLGLLAWAFAPRNPSQPSAAPRVKTGKPGAGVGPASEASPCRPDVGRARPMTDRDERGGNWATANRDA